MIADPMPESSSEVQAYGNGIDISVLPVPVSRPTGIAGNGVSIKNKNQAIAGTGMLR
jgi:hypothetical protein